MDVENNAGLSDDQQPEEQGRPTRADGTGAGRGALIKKTAAWSEQVPARSSTSFGVFLVCLLFGFLLTMQFKSVTISRRLQDNNQQMQAEELQKQLEREQARNQELSTELLRYKDDLTKYRETALVNAQQVTSMGIELERAEFIAGLTDVIGPGVEVVMQDADDSIDVDPTIDPNFYIIHDGDLLRVVNELRDAGAEAISINGERLVATSEIRCAGSIVSVNNNRYAAPYTIRAIGDSQTLLSALSMRGGVLDLSSSWIKVEARAIDSMIIARYAGKTSFKYAQEYKPAGSQPSGQGG